MDLVTVAVVTAMAGSPVLEWEAKWGVLPVDDGWSMCPGEFPGTIDGVLGVDGDGVSLMRVTDNDKTLRYARCMPDVFGDPSQDAIYSWVGRALCSLGCVTHDFDFVVSIGFRDGIKRTTMQMSMDAIGFTRLGESGTEFIPGAVYELDTTEVHQYDIVKHGQEVMVLWVDDVPVMEVDYGLLFPKNWVSYVSIAGTAGPCTSMFEVYSVRFAVGVTELPAPCPCDCGMPPDCVVDVGDLMLLLSQWGGRGSCSCARPRSGYVNVLDFLELLGAWGDCPKKQE